MQKYDIPHPERQDREQDREAEPIGQEVPTRPQHRLIERPRVPPRNPGVLAVDPHLDQCPDISGFALGPFLLLLIALSYAPRIILLYAISTMIEIVIERWTNAEGETDFRW